MTIPSSEHHYIDSLTAADELQNPTHAIATGEFCTYQGRCYQYIGDYQCAFTTAVIAKRILTIAVLAIATLASFGFLLYIHSFRSTLQHNWHEIVTRNDIKACYALHNLENWCILQHPEAQIDLDKPFSIKKYWDKALRKEWWNCELNYKQLQKIHDVLIRGRSAPPLIVNTPLAPSVTSVPGISILAHYLSVKGERKNLCVCQDLKAFQEKLEEIAKTDGDQRWALIVPTFSSVLCNDRHANFEQHKICVAIEKEGDDLRICLLDGQPSAVDPSRVRLDSNGPFDSHDLVHSYIQDTLLPFTINREVYGPYVHWTTPNQVVGYRQFGFEGICPTFALRDAAAFLEDKDFFKKLKVISGKGLVLDRFIYEKLPPNFLKGMQSYSKLQEYIKTEGDLMLEPVGRSGRTFFDSMTLHRMDVNGHPQNKMMSRRNQKYQLMLLFLLNNLSDEQILELSERSLVVSQNPLPKKP